MSGGRIPGRRRASIVLPDPGGPTKSRLWPPAAAISSARRGTSCPRTSARSAVLGAVAGRRPRDDGGGGPGEAAPPRRAAARPARPDSAGPARRRAPTTAASPAFSAGTTSRRTARARAQAAMGSTPRTGRSVPSSASSPTNSVSASAPGSTTPAAHSMPDGDRDVERGAVLAQVGGREVDGDPPRRQPEAAVLERAPDAHPPLADAGVGQADDVAAGEPHPDVDLDVDGRGLDSDHRRRRDPCEHAPSLCERDASAIPRASRTRAGPDRRPAAAVPEPAAARQDPDRARRAAGPGSRSNRVREDELSSSELVAGGAGPSQGPESESREGGRAELVRARRGGRGTLSGSRINESREGGRAELVRGSSRGARDPLRVPNQIIA